MRFTVAKKISIGLAIIMFIGTLSMLIIYNGLSSVKQAMLDLDETQGPIILATREIEINVNGIAMAVLGYLNTTDSRLHKFLKEDEADFVRFHTQYLQLIKTQKERELGDRLSVLYEEFITISRSLIGKRDEQESIFSTIGNNFERVDEVLDKQLQTNLNPYDPDWLRKIGQLMNLEADIAEVGSWLANYQRIHKKEYRDLIFANEREFRESLEQFKNLNLNENETYWIEVLEGVFNQTMALTRDVLALDDDLRAQTRKFIDLRSQIDGVLDEEVEVLAIDNLRAPREEADQATAQVSRRIFVTIPLFILSMVGVALLLLRVITDPVKRLMHGTDAISRGDLSHRLVPTGRDEFADLANHFNRMVAQLEATTVSKGLLEASEAKLQQTVADLCREIAERQRAQEEQARLEASLRRSETMAMMGSLVAGVAHEVRNPLFGISSTLDAFEARFGAREEYERYIHVLRGELTRLTELMQELLEYGRPPSSEPSPERIEDVIAEAVQACAPLAKRLNVEVVNNVQQAVQNLLENAVQHSPPGGVVTMEAEAVRDDEHAWVDCAVKDSGPGFQAEDLPRLFEPFFTRRRGGTGLGLSIVQRIVEEHHGTIAASSRPEGGAVMTVRLPLAES